MHHRKSPKLHNYQQITLNNFQTKTIDLNRPSTQSNQSNASIHPINETFNYNIQNSGISKSKSISRLSYNDKPRHNTNTYYHKQIQRVLINQNNNLKQHNEFLINEIKNMYQRQSKYKKKLKKYSNIISQIQQINNNLNQQMNNIVNIVMQQIQRIQFIIKKNNSLYSYHQQSDNKDTSRQNQYKQIQQKYVQTLSRSFFAYSEPSENIYSPKSKNQESMISNKLMEIKEKINFMMSNKKQYINVFQIKHDQEYINKKNIEKEGHIIVPSGRYQILSTNTNSEMHELPMEIIRVNKKDKNRKQY